MYKIFRLAEDRQKPNLTGRSTICRYIPVLRTLSERGARKIYFRGQRSELAFRFLVTNSRSDAKKFSARIAAFYFPAVRSGHSPEGDMCDRADIAPYYTACAFWLLVMLIFFVAKLWSPSCRGLAHGIPFSRAVSLPSPSAFHIPKQLSNFCCRLTVKPEEIPNVELSFHSFVLPAEYKAAAQSMISWAYRTPRAQPGPLGRLLYELYTRAIWRIRIKEQFSLFADGVAPLSNQMRLPGERLAPPGAKATEIGAAPGSFRQSAQPQDRRADQRDGAYGFGEFLSAVKVKNKFYSRQSRTFQFSAAYRRAVSTYRGRADADATRTPAGVGSST